MHRTRPCCVSRRDKIESRPRRLISWASSPFAVALVVPWLLIFLTRPFPATLHSCNWGLLISYFPLLTSLHSLPVAQSSSKMLNLAISSLALFGAVAFAQERCDAPYPTVYCNTTEILAFQSSDCSPYHVFLTRGSDEPYPGRLGNITSEICRELGDGDCTFENIEYPAKSTAWGQDEWCKSAGKGAANGQAQVKAYAEKCSHSKLILLGYSQGAAVTQDILGGGGGAVFQCTQDTNPALDRSSSPGSQSMSIPRAGWTMMLTIRSCRRSHFRRCCP